MDPLEQARALFMQALEHHNAQRLVDAERLYREALAHAPDRVSILANLAVVLASQGRLAEARSPCERALALEPGHGDAQVVLAACLREEGRASEALGVLEAVAAGRPDDARAQSNLALVMADLGRLDAAASLHRQAGALAPEDGEPAAQLSRVEARRGRLAAAFDALRPALAADMPDLAARAAFVELSTDWGCGLAQDTTYRRSLQAALVAPWCRPQRLVPAVLATLRADPALGTLLEAVAAAWPARPALRSADRALLDDPLLPALLGAAPLADAGFERLLATLRHGLLAATHAAHASLLPAVAGSTRTGEAASPDLACALARQCYINEYVYPLGRSELGEAVMLRRACEAQLDAGRLPPADWLAVLGAYLPLSRVAGASRLRDADWPPPVAALLRQQVVEPAAERDAAAEVERITAIVDPVSQRVRDQYQQHPYPRWVGTALPAAAQPLDAYLRRRFPGGPYPPPAPRSPMTALNAGCGTGQLPIETALRFSDMRVLAMDLSAASLGCAIRKADEAGLRQLRFVQGDILGLVPSHQRFDLIEADGVLHHMDDPAKGLARLVSVLADDGVIKLGLYSQRSGAAVGAARAHVARRRYSPTAEGIRACREEILAMNDVDWAREIAAMPDFHATSGCRNLIFHVQEHRFTLDGVSMLLAGAGLRFIGMDTDARQAGLFRARFGEAGDRFDLAAWDALEAEHADLFAGMYQLWAQPIAAPR